MALYQQHTVCIAYMMDNTAIRELLLLLHPFNGFFPGHPG